jgi:hypothetical protein
MNKILSSYGLARPPFTKEITPSEMLQTEMFQEALQSLKAAVEGRALCANNSETPTPC